MIVTSAPVPAPLSRLPFTQTNIAVGTTLTFTSLRDEHGQYHEQLVFTLDPTVDGAAYSGYVVDEQQHQQTASSLASSWANVPAGNYTMKVTATETSTGASTNQSFKVNVILTNNCPQEEDILTAVAQRRALSYLTNCPTPVLTNTLIISNNVTIVAETNVTITANNLTRLFIVRSGGSLTLGNLTLTGGRSGSGGAIYVMTNGACLLTNCIVVGNSAVGENGPNGVNGADDPNFGANGTDGWPGAPAVGGAICNLGQLEADGCLFLTNSATGGSGGNGGNGGSGSYQSGNGGHAGAGALASGGAIYNVGDADAGEQFI